MLIDTERLIKRCIFDDNLNGKAESLKKYITISKELADLGITEPYESVLDLYHKRINLDQIELIDILCFVDDRFSRNEPYRVELDMNILNKYSHIYENYQLNFQVDFISCRTSNVFNRYMITPKTNNDIDKILLSQIGMHNFTYGQCMQIIDKIVEKLDIDVDNLEINCSDFVKLINCKYAKLLEEDPNEVMKLNLKGM